MEKRTNISIPVMLNVKISLAVVYKQRILRFLGHIIMKDREKQEPWENTNPMDWPDKDRHWLSPESCHSVGRKQSSGKRLLPISI